MSALTSKIRLYDLAKELKIDTRRLIQEVRREGVNVSVPSNQISKEVAEKIRNRLRQTRTAPSTKQSVNLTYKPFAQLLSDVKESDSSELIQQNQPVSFPQRNLTTTPTSHQTPKQKKTKVCPVCTDEFKFRKQLSTHVFKAHGYVLVGNKAVKPTWKVLRKPAALKPVVSIQPANPTTVAHKKPTSIPPGNKPAVHVSASAIPVVTADKLLNGFGINIIHTVRREADAVLLRVRLENQGATINLIPVPDDHSSQAHAGKLYYLSPGKNPLYAARKLASLISDVEKLGPEFYEFPNLSGITHSLWLVRERPNPFEVSAAQATASTPVTPTQQIPSKAPEYNLSSQVVERLQRKDFGALRELIDACLKGRRVRAEDQSLVTNDPATLREYARILKTKLHGSPAGEKILRRILEDIQIFSSRGAQFGAKKLPWKLLPRGKQPFQALVQHFQNLSRQSSSIIFDINRLHRAYSLNPDEVFVGTDEFQGYVVFYFSGAQTAVLDCPVTGNAIYIFGEDWKSLCRLTKYDLLNSRKIRITRIIHRGAWFSRLKSIVATRWLRAGIRH